MSGRTRPAEKAALPEIGAMRALVAEFDQCQQQRKLAIDPHFPWYPYSSLGTLVNLDEVLREERRFLLDLLARGPVLDLGCADGDIAFFLESHGIHLTAADWPPTNYNQLRGVRLLKERLGSKLEIAEMDLNGTPVFPEWRGGTALAFGLLYHLKNPILVLERLASSVSYLLLSTRVARYGRRGGAAIDDLPVAYLVGADETNQDETNYWIFSPAGVRRLLERTGWDVLDFGCLGNPESDPATPEGDERAFVLASSRINRPVSNGRLLDGWHDVEAGAWRWTRKRFAVAFRHAAGVPLQLELEVTLPEALFTGPGEPVRLSIRGIGEETFVEPGRYKRTLALTPRRDTESVIDCEWSRSLHGFEGDDREFGGIVYWIGLRYGDRK